MRIAIFSETYLPDVNGVATHVKILADGLQRLGHEVLVVTADAKSRKNYIEKGVLRCPAITAKKIYNYSLSSPVSLSRLRILKKFKPDIIHIHNEFGIGLSGAFIAKLLRIPYVYTLHTVYDDYIHYVAKKLFVPIVTDASHVYFRLLGKKATAITGPSKKVDDFFKSCGVKTPVSVIANSAELDIFEPHMIDKEKVEKFRKDNGIKDTDFVGCFCGRLGQEKGIDTLLSYWEETVSEKDNLKLVIFGGGPEEENLKALAEKLGIEKEVIFTGKIPHVELPHYYAACNFYITASMTEMHSISMIEAMASGLPVLYINDESNKSQIDDGVNGFIYSDANEMHDKIIYLKNLSKDDYEAFRERVRKSVSKSGAEGIAEILLGIYTKAIVNYKGIETS